MEMIKDRPHTAYIALGSNMGDRLAHCRQGIMGLEASGDSIVTGRSRLYKTDPLEYKDQDWFLNAVVRIATRLKPLDLLAELNAIEKQAGRDRTRGVRFGPRTLDVDIIFYDDLIMDAPALTLPHPRMHQRRFVLEPICDIDPDAIHPILQMSAAGLRDRLEDQGVMVYEI